MQDRAPDVDPRRPLRAALLGLALVLHLAVGTFLLLDGFDRADGAETTVEASRAALVLPGLLPAAVALVLALALPGRAPRRSALVLGTLAVVLALLLVPVYGLGLLLLPQAGLALAAGCVPDRPLEAGRVSRTGGPA